MSHKPVQPTGRPKLNKTEVSFAMKKHGGGTRIRETVTEEEEDDSDKGRKANVARKGRNAGQRQGRKT